MLREDWIGFNLFKVIYGKMLASFLVLRNQQYQELLRLKKYKTNCHVFCVRQLVNLYVKTVKKRVTINTIFQCAEWIVMLLVPVKSACCWHIFANWTRNKQAMTVKFLLNLSVQLSRFLLRQIPIQAQFRRFAPTKNEQRKLSFLSVRWILQKESFLRTLSVNQAF